MATVSNLYIDQGSDFSVVIDLTNQDGTPIDLTNYTIRSQFRKSYQSSSATTFEASVFSAHEGQIKLYLPASSSTNLNAGRFLYDVEITSPDGERKRVLEGIVVLTPEITKI